MILGTVDTKQRLMELLKLLHETVSQCNTGAERDRAGGAVGTPTAAPPPVAGAQTDMDVGAAVTPPSDNER